MKDTQKANRKTGQKVLYLIIYCLVFFCFITLIGEFILRTFIEPPLCIYKTELDDQLGWKPKSCFHSKYMATDSNGNKYPVNYKTDIDGFREFGDIHSKQPKVLFLGDSFTQSVEVSNEKTFYKQLKETLGIEIFAFGQSGFSNLQEYFVLSNYFELIQPDLIILQVCDNDIIDNYEPLEWDRMFKIGLRRPYINVNDRTIYYETTYKDWERFLDQSKFLSLTYKMLMYFLPGLDTSEDRIKYYQEDYSLLIEALEATDLIFKKILDRINDTPLVVFSANLYPPVDKAFQKVLENNNIILHTEIEQEIKNSIQNNQNVTTKDGYHWNEKGHQIVATELSKIITPILSEQLCQKD